MATQTRSVGGTDTDSNGEINAVQPPLFIIPYCEDHGYNSKTVELQATTQDTAQAMTRAAEHHAKLQDSITVLSDALGTADNNSPEVRQSLKDLGNSAKQLQDFIKSCVASIPSAMMPSKQSAMKAEQVFGTAELVEEIFLNLTPFDVLSALQITRRTCQIFADSPKLQDKLHLRPSRRAHLETIFTDSSPYSLRAGWHPGHGLNEPWPSRTPSPPADVPLARTITARFEEASALKLGDTCRRMLICQPPINEMRVGLYCCPGSYLPDSRTSSPERFLSYEALSRQRSSKRSGVQRTITSNTGLTVGDLYDMTQKLREEHRYCPNASVSQHNKDGMVEVEVHFEASVMLSHNDPQLKQISDTTTRQRLSQIRYKANTDRLEVYVQAKRTASANGWPIPTFEEFKANYADGEETNDVIWY